VNHQFGTVYKCQEIVDDIGKPGLVEKEVILDPGNLTCPFVNRPIRIEVW
jgi:hypothetical protein